MTRMKKYITLTSVHFYLCLTMSIIGIMLADASFKMFGFVVSLSIPLWITYLYRVKHMSAEELSEQFGFKDNKYFDISEE